MSVLVAKLLRGSGVSAGSHPLLVSLLEFASAGPGVFERGKGGALSRKLSRHWKRVSEAFRACVTASVSDDDLRAETLPEGLSVQSGGVWVAGPRVGHGYREKAAELLESVVRRKSENDGRVACVIGSLEDLREARKVNGLPALGRLPNSPGRIESGFVGGRFVMSWSVHGARVWFVFTCDEFGDVRCVGHRGDKKSALELLNLEPAKS